VLFTCCVSTAVAELVEVCLLSTYPLEALPSRDRTAEIMELPLPADFICVVAHYLWC
jgi:hypothetical protein